MTLSNFATSQGGFNVASIYGYHPTPPHIGGHAWQGWNNSYQPPEYFNYRPPPNSWDRSYQQSWYPHPYQSYQGTPPPPWADYGYEDAYYYRDPLEDPLYWYDGEEESLDSYSDRSASPASDRSTSPVKDPTDQGGTPTLINNPTWYPESPWVGSSTVLGSIMEHCKNAYSSIFSKKTTANEERVNKKTEVEDNNAWTAATYNDLVNRFNEITSSLPSQIRGSLDVRQFALRLSDLGTGLQNIFELGGELYKGCQDELGCSEKLTDLSELMGNLRDRNTEGWDVRTAREMLNTYGSQSRNDESDNPVNSPAGVFLNSHYGNAQDDARIPFYSTEAKNDHRDTDNPQGTSKGAADADIFAGLDSAGANWSNLSYQNSFGYNPFGNTFNNNPFAYNNPYQNLNTGFTADDYWDSFYNEERNASLRDPLGPRVSFSPATWANLRYA